MWIIAYWIEKQYNSYTIPEDVFGYGNAKYRFWGQEAVLCPEYFLKGSRNSYKFL